MQGAAIQNAVSAARTFIATKPPADRVMLIGFGHQAVRLTGFSSATIDTDAALESLAVDKSKAPRSTTRSRSARARSRTSRTPVAC